VEKLTKMDDDGCHLVAKAHMDFGKTMILYK